MAAASSEIVSDDRKTDTNQEYDPNLDFLSEHFDPLKALKTPGVVPPVVNVKPYDNIAKYEMGQRSDRSVPPRASQAGTSNTTTLSNQRRWLPHQLPIRREMKFKPKNVFTRMEGIKGPLSFLKKCKDERIRIKVWTRHSHGVRGYCTAFVTLFDKYWNMVLEDVTEIWTRTKRRKVPAGLEHIPSSSVVHSRNRPLPPPVKIIKSDKKTETCERHVHQLLIRGEHVVIITTCDKVS